jgi:hypothetical protein
MIPDRVVLEGVPYVGPDLHTVETDGARRCLEGATCLSCIRSCLEYAGHCLGSTVIPVCGAAWRLDHLYVYLMGVTGCTFRLNWGPGWGLDNSALFNMADDAGAPHRRAGEALGIRQSRSVWKGEHDETAFRRLIIEAIHEAGVPLQAHGVIGPPEGSLITGYDEGGDVLLGWSYYQGRPGQPVGWWGDLNRDGVVEWNAQPDVEFELSGYYRKPNWYPGTWDVSYGVSKAQMPPLEDVYRDALAWAVQVVRTPVTHGKMANGIAAYEAWAEALERHDDFPKHDIDVLRDRYMVHTGTTRVVAEGRWYAARFLEQVVEHEPDLAEPLLAAVACYETEHELMWEAWRLVGYEADNPLLWHNWIFSWADMDQLDARAHTLADQAIRGRIVPLVLQARAKDTEAIGHIERALTQAA